MFIIFRFNRYMRIVRIQKIAVTRTGRSSYCVHISMIRCVIGRLVLETRRKSHQSHDRGQEVGGGRWASKIGGRRDWWEVGPQTRCEVFDGTQY